MGHQVAIITGATGLTGRHCLQRIYSAQTTPPWRIVTLSRRPLDLSTLSGSSSQKQEEEEEEEKRQKNEIVQAHADLLVKPEVKAALEKAISSDDDIESVRIYHCAYVESGEGPVRDCHLNVTMLKNVVESVEEHKKWPLQHVFTMEGTKWYGQQFLHPLKTPFNETDSRHIGPNFYYDLEDYLISRVEQVNEEKGGGGGCRWSWSALRPGPVIGYSPGSLYMSLLPTIAVYGTLMKELGLEMHFPGTEAAYEAPMEVCDARVLADAMFHISTHSDAGNAAYNINNGDIFRWSDVWPKLCEEGFGVKAGRPLNVGDLTQAMSVYENVWGEIAKKHGLKEILYKKLATWKFMEFVFQMPSSGWFSNTIKLRRAGYHGMVVDSGESMVAGLQEMRANKIIP